MSVDETQISTLVREILVTRVGLTHDEVGELAPTELLFGETSRLALDSVDVLELAMGMEQRFSGHFGDETDVEVLKSVAAITHFLNTAGDPEVVIP